MFNSREVGDPAGPVPGPPRRRADGSHAGGADPRSVLVPGLGRPIRVKIASEREEFEQAFRLLAARYRNRGYDTPGSGEFRFTPFHALPGTVTFVAKDGERVAATLSLVPDNPTLGLPMESLYGEEVGALRREEKGLAEVTSLADDGLGTREFLRVFSALIRLMFQYHVRVNGGDTWVITVNPRHRGYYSKVLGFEPLGPCRPYSAVRGHLAEAFVLDVDTMRVNAPVKHQEIFGEPLPVPVLTAVGRPADHAPQFGARSTQADRRTILAVLAAAGVSKARTEACGSWHSRRCSPIGADC
jgi:hypothetical protein